MAIQYPDGGMTSDIGEPYALVVVDKRYADKPPSFEMINDEPDDTYISDRYC